MLPNYKFDWLLFGFNSTAKLCSCQPGRRLKSQKVLSKWGDNSKIYKSETALYKVEMDFPCLRQPLAQETQLEQVYVFLIKCFY